MKCTLPLILGAAALLASAFAQATDVRPGLWEFRTTQLNVNGMPDMSAQLAQAQQYLRSLPPEMRQMAEQQMAARGVKLNNDGTVRSCITPEQAKQANIYSGRNEGNCTLTNVAKSETTVTGTLSCTQPQASGNFEARIENPERFTTRVNMRSAQGDVRVNTDARWLAAQCGASPEPAAPNRRVQP